MGGCLDIFTLLYPFFPLSPSLWETARYRLKYYLKGPLNQNNQPTNNATPHRSLNFIAPKDVNKSNGADLWAFIFFRKPAKEAKRTPKKRTAPYKFKLGDLFLISSIHFDVLTNSNIPQKFSKSISDTEGRASQCINSKIGMMSL